MPPKKILIIYEYFYPAYKAGGIVQSLRNLVLLLGKQYQFYCITGGYDLNETQPLQNIRLNEWNEINIGEAVSISIWYDDKKKVNPLKLYRLINHTQPSVIYINGFMSLPFLIYPLIAIRSTRLKNIKTIIAPRGMLQEGAVEVKATKKKWYLHFIKKLKLTLNMHWHITSENEVSGLSIFHSPKNKIHLLGNIPQQPLTTIQATNKNSNQLRLIYASIITAKKNLLYLLLSLQHCKQTIHLDIYGVVKEEDYWKHCLKAAAVLPPNITMQYKGSYEQENMQAMIAQYDALVLLSKGENFAHAIFESLGAGRPIISSNFTSWNLLTEKNAGWNLAMDAPENTAEAIDQLALINQNEWNIFCQGAHQLALEYIAQQNFKKDYSLLFG